MSLLLDLLPTEIKENTTLAFRGLSTFFHPSRYINLLKFENPIVIFIRFLVFSFTFSALQVVVFASSSKSIPFWITSFKAFVFDLIISTILFPAFWVPLKFLKHEHPIKVIYGYMFPLRVVLLIPSIITYALFLATEAYFWAAARGIVFYIAILALLSLPSFNSFNRPLKKVSAVIVTFVVYYATSLSFASLLIHFSHGSNMTTQMLLLYDPISFEVENKTDKFNDISHLNFYPTSFKQSCDIVFNGTKSTDKETLHLDKEAMLLLQANWIHERGYFYARITQLEVANKSVTDTCEFDTSKNMLSKDLDLLSQSRLISSLLDDYAKAPTAKKLSLIIPEYIKLQKHCIARKDLTINHYNNVNPLLKYALLFY